MMNPPQPSFLPVSYLLDSLRSKLTLDSAQVPVAPHTDVLINEAQLSCSRLEQKLLKEQAKARETRLRIKAIRQDLFKAYCQLGYHRTARNARERTVGHKR